MKAFGRIPSDQYNIDMPYNNSATILQINEPMNFQTNF